MKTRFVLLLLLATGLLAGGTASAAHISGMHAAHAMHEAPCPHHLVTIDGDAGCLHHGGCQCAHACSATVATVAVWLFTADIAARGIPATAVPPSRTGMITLPWRPPTV